MKKVLLITILSGLGHALMAMEAPIPERELSSREVLDLPLEKLLVYAQSLPEAPEPHRLVEEMYKIGFGRPGYTELEAKLYSSIKKDPANLAIEDSNGNTLFHLLARLNDTRIFKRLYSMEEGEKRAELLEAQNNHGQTPLHKAAMFGNVEIAKALLETDLVIPDIKDKEGRTPLHQAAAEDRFEMVVLLLGEGANPDAQDNQKKKPIDLAIEKGAFDIMELLELSKGQ